MGIFDAKQISTQEHLDIEDIRDNYVVLKNGVVSSIIETTSVNFDLLDGREQDAKIGTFAAFLNSIRFPVQVVIRTQRTDIARYLKLLDRYKANTNSTDVLGQLELYQDFITNLTQSTQILDKRFYTVIPSQRLPVISTSWVRQVLGQKKKIINIAQLVAKASEELQPKTDNIIKQFGNMGLGAKQLQNDELIKMYYSVYEPDVTGLDLLNLQEKEIEKGLVQGG